MEIYKGQNVCDSKSDSCSRLGQSHASRNSNDFFLKKFYAVDSILVARLASADVIRVLSRRPLHGGAAVGLGGGSRLLHGFSVRP